MAYCQTRDIVWKSIETDPTCSNVDCRLPRNLLSLVTMTNLLFLKAAGLNCSQVETHERNAEAASLFFKKIVHYLFQFVVIPFGYGILERFQQTSDIKSSFPQDNV